VGGLFWWIIGCARRVVEGWAADFGGVVLIRCEVHGCCDVVVVYVDDDDGVGTGLNSIDMWR
jgi:hypothetical protein